MINFLKNIFTVIVAIAVIIAIIVGGYILGIILTICLVFYGGYFLVSEYRKATSEEPNPSEKPKSDVVD